MAAMCLAWVRAWIECRHWNVTTEGGADLQGDGEFAFGLAQFEGLGPGKWRQLDSEV